MTFVEMLRALVKGHCMHRATEDPTNILMLQKATVPILTNGLVDSKSDLVQPIKDNWTFCKYVLNGHGAPYAFSDAEMSSTDWSIFIPDSVEQEG